MKYERLEIEKVEFGEADFLTWSGQGGNYGQTATMKINGVYYTVVTGQGMCGSYEAGSSFCPSITVYFPGNSNPQTFMQVPFSCSAFHF